MTGKILIVDDMISNRLALRAILDRDYYTVIEANDGKEAVEMAKTDQPDLILLDVSMPVLDGFEACRQIKADPRTANIPVVMITTADCLEEKNKGLEAGAEDFLTRPIDHVVLFARVRNLLRVKSLLDELQLRGELSEKSGNEYSNAQNEPTQRLLIVSTSEALAQEWASQLLRFDRYQIDVSSNEGQALEMAMSAEYDMMVVAENLENDGIGLRLISKLRSDWAKRDMAILFVAQTGTKAGLRALEFGSNDYMLEPLDPRELATRLHTQNRRQQFTQSLRQQVNKQLRLSMIDPLTELYNRRYFDDYMPKILARAQDMRKPVALMMIDIDHFKALNDQYGHDFGDKVLTEFSTRIRETLRAADLIVRFGGEEFIVISPNVTRTEARHISERIRKTVVEQAFHTVKGEKIDVTASVGVAMIAPGERDIAAIMKRADRALYQAKEKGRNQVIFAPA